MPLTKNSDLEADAINVKKITISGSGVFINDMSKNIFIN